VVLEYRFYLLSDTSVVFKMELREDNIPGASLCGREASELKIPELKRWLACRGTPLKDKKADLVARFVNAIMPNSFLVTSIKPF